MPTAVSAALALAVALLALSLPVAFRPRYRVALVTTVIVLLRYRAAGRVVGAALDRVIEIGLGHRRARRGADHHANARAHKALCTAADTRWANGGKNRDDAWRMTSSPDPVAVTRLHDRTRPANATAFEAARERRSYMSATPGPEPLARMLEHQPRLRHQFPFAAHATARAGAQPAHRCNGGAGRGVRRDPAGSARR